jgi:hypothetical protein
MTKPKPQKPATTDNKAKKTMITRFFKKHPKPENYVEPTISVKAP